MLDPPRRRRSLSPVTSLTSFGSPRRGPQCAVRLEAPATYPAPLVGEGPACAVGTGRQRRVGTGWKQGSSRYRAGGQPKARSASGLRPAEGVDPGRPAVCFSALLTQPARAVAEQELPYCEPRQSFTTSRWPARCLDLRRCTASRCRACSRPVSSSASVASPVPHRSHRSGGHVRLRRLRR